MGHQIPHHKSAVTVPCHSDAVATGDTKAHGLINGSLGISHELFQVGAVGLLWIPDDGDGSGVDARVAGERQQSISSLRLHFGDDTKYLARKKSDWRQGIGNTD